MGFNSGFKGLNTQHSQETDVHAAGGIQTRNPSKRAAADRRLRPRGHRDRHLKYTAIDQKVQRLLHTPLTLLLSSYLRLGLPSEISPSGFPTKILYTALPSTMRATRPTYLIIHNSVYSFSVFE